MRSKGEEVERNNHRMVIESLGVYLPPNSVSTSEVVEGCDHPLDFPLESLSGIRSRRMAGEDEYSIDLARKAIEDCFSRSKYGPSDIDLLICCNISRFDSPRSFTYEPTTSLRLQHEFGLDRAMAFDLTNACAGLFTGLYVVDALLKLGSVRRALIVSGEYITHLTLTAQKELEGPLDPRLACLTLGDAGAALLLEETDEPEVGFHALELFTASRWGDLCIAKATDQPHGGAIMLTDSLRLSAVATRYAIWHAVHILEVNGWSPSEIQHLIMHQTSRRSIAGAIREINNLLGPDTLSERNTIDNLADRGNTATTTHWVAVMDHVLQGRIRPGDKTVFSIDASGITVGTALYVFDDLPERIINGRPTLKKNVANEENPPSTSMEDPRVRIESVGVLPDGIQLSLDGIEMAAAAARSCLERSKYLPNDIGLLIHAGVYRKDYLSEPALASLIAGRLLISDDPRNQQDAMSLAFDVLDGSVGTLTSCYLAAQMIRAGRTQRAMVLASEVENNKEALPDELRGIQEIGSALILDTSPDPTTGFGHFLFRSFSEHLEDFLVDATYGQGQTRLRVRHNGDLMQAYLECLPSLMEELLALEGIRRTQITTLFGPQISSRFLIKLAHRLDIATERIVDLTTDGGGDYFTSSIPYALHHTWQEGRVQKGDVGLILSVSAGIKVGGAIYYF